jgi:aldose 1-epimerase
MSVVDQACGRERKEEGLVPNRVFDRLQDNREVMLYSLSNDSGVSVDIIDFGATITSLRVPDRNGIIADVVLGYDTVAGYLDGSEYFGAIVGRYGNRIAGGRFTIDGKKYQVTMNEGDNHLHGGRIGFNKVLWNAAPFRAGEDASIQFRHISPDGEEGYPGTVEMKVTYTLMENSGLRIDYEGTTDAPTILNPTQHSYFNLSGSMTSSILDHLLLIEADFLTPVDRGLIPTGAFMNVENTPFDFRTMTEIGARIDDPDEQLSFGQGYDHNWVLKGPAGRLRKAAELFDPASGRLMTVSTDQAGLQFYSGNLLDGTTKGKGGIPYRKRTGMCLEAQAFPDTPNKPHFPPVTLRAGQKYRQTTIYHFSTR